MVRKAEKALPNVGRFLDPDAKDNLDIFEWLKVSAKHRHSARGRATCSTCARAFDSGKENLEHEIDEEHLDCRALEADKHEDDRGTVIFAYGRCMSCPCFKLPPRRPGKFRQKQDGYGETRRFA